MRVKLSGLYCVLTNIDMYVEKILDLQHYVFVDATFPSLFWPLYSIARII